MRHFNLIFAQKNKDKLNLTNENLLTYSDEIVKGKY